MNKKITIIDLLMEISKGNVKHGTKFNVLYKNNKKRKVYYDANEPNAFACIKNVSDDLPMYDEVRFNEEVEILEDEEEIDIQSMEEVNHYNICSTNRLITEENINDELSKYSIKINELLKAVKQLDKKINKED